MVSQISFPCTVLASSCNEVKSAALCFTAESLHIFIILIFLYLQGCPVFTQTKGIHFSVILLSGFNENNNKTKKRILLNLFLTQASGSEQKQF